MAVVGQTGQGILGRLLTEMILQLALFGDILGYDFVTLHLAFSAADFPSAEPDLQIRAVPSLPVNFYGIDLQFLAGVTQQLRPFARIRDDVTCKVDYQEFLL